VTLTPAAMLVQQIGTTSARQGAGRLDKADAGFYYAR